MKFLTRSGFSFLLLAIITFSCSQEEEPQLQPTVPDSQQSKLIPQSELDQLILKSIQETGDFIWMDQTDEVIWSALVQSDSILTIGYQPAGSENLNARIGQISVSDPQWVAAAQKVITQVNETRTSRGNPQLRINNQDADIHEDLPFLEMKVGDIQVLRDLRLMEEVRYYEPLSYEFDLSLLQGAEEARIMSDSGCSNDPNPNIPGSDFSVISPNARQSWNYSQMGISQAWATSTGAGVTVGIIDTGVSSSQPLLGSSFGNGASLNSRSISKFGTYQTGFWWWKRPDGPNDRCGHGTAMSGVIASPRNGVGNAVGVAYNANLVSVRGTSDVVVNSGNEKDGVADALVLLGKRSDVKIISMSIGDVFSNSKVADAVRYAYNRGKLIFAAAGTSTSFTNWVGVIFPASMSETVAVTGVKEGSGYRRCDTCHSGSQVEFTVVMERAGSENKPLTTAQSGNTPATVGGSSVATATAAGIAALVWQRYPSLNRDQILQKMRESSDLYPNKNSQYGYGNLNAARAVGIF